MEAHGEVSPTGTMTKKVSYATPLWRRIPRTLHNLWNLRKG